MKSRQQGSAMTEWTLITVLLSVVLFTPYIGDKSPATLLFDAIGTALNNSATIVSVP